MLEPVDGGTRVPHYNSFIHRRHIDINGTKRQQDVRVLQRPVVRTTIVLTK